MKCKLERKVLGVSATRHPLAAFMRATGSDGYIRAGELAQHAGERVELLGWIVCTKRVRTLKGDYMRFITMEDTTDLFEVVLFPRCYHRYGHLLKTPGPFAVRGRAMDDGGVIVLNADRLRLLILGADGLGD
jgi:DNA polymerase-3 subunit alpha